MLYGASCCPPFQVMSNPFKHSLALPAGENENWEFVAFADMVFKQEVWEEAPTT